MYYQQDNYMNMHIFLLKFLIHVIFCILQHWTFSNGDKVIFEDIIWVVIIKVYIKSCYDVGIPVQLRSCTYIYKNM